MFKISAYWAALVLAILPDYCLCLLSHHENRVLSREAGVLAEFLVDVLQSDVRGIVLNDAHARSTRNSDREVEIQVALVRFLLALQRTAPASSCDLEKSVKNVPIERPEQLRYALLPAAMLSGRQLHCEGELGVVVAVYNETTEAESLSTTILKLRTELLDPDEVLIAIFVLLFDG